ncbi:serine/threonine-protein phosphatase 7 long form-like protein [Senna tora]|uniref:Serine/threonine-protein phosphatase 7 long form-like protein n=1 Tax=Senna tora TaxID=362788 RepID=A0A834WU10_9FABA|nr:serine/threonine-protein phosphatase 7 long form-like protein [Senna tora]
MRWRGIGPQGQHARAQLIHGLGFGSSTVSPSQSLTLILPLIHSLSSSLSFTHSHPPSGYRCRRSRRRHLLLCLGTGRRRCGTDILDTPTVCPRRTRSTTYVYAPPAFVPLLISSDFYGASRASYFPYDWHLVTAFIMQWRPETHMFHMAVGIRETTITLEDVAIQLGLPIEGKAVTSTKPDIEGQRVKISWLEQNIPLDDGPRGDVSDEELRQMVRAYIVRLIGGFLMPDTSGNKVSLICLPLLRNLEEVGQYSWGSTILAYLFREMCEAMRWDCENMGRCAHLLLAWAWGQISHPRTEVERAQDPQVERQGRGSGVPCSLST